MPLKVSRTDDVAVALLRKLVRTLVGSESDRLLPPEIVIWPAASNDRRLVAVCSRCNKTLRSGFAAEAVRGPYNHVCDTLDSRSTHR